MLLFPDWLTGWLTPPPPWSAYCALMLCRLVALDKRPGVHPVGIGEMLCRSLAKLVMREAGDQAKTACGNLQLCVGLEASIDGATHALGQRRIERARQRQSNEEERKPGEGEDKDEEAEAVRLEMETEVQRRRWRRNLMQRLRWRWRKKARERKGVIGI